MTRIEGVPSARIREVLPIVHAAFALMAHRSNGRWEVPDIVEWLETQKMQLWLIFDGQSVRAVILTEIVVYPRKKALRLAACVARGWRDLIHHRHDLWRWGQEQGCDLFEALAPRKWLRAMPEFKEFHVLMECK